MPLLSEEPAVFPENLFESPGNTDLEDRWWVLHTKPRAEKALARRLLGNQSSFFLPQYEKKWRYRGRFLSSRLPVFSSYLFLYGNQEARIQAFETKLVANALFVVDQAQLFHDLQRVYTLMTSGVTLAPEERIQPGEPVEIVGGPFAGMEGKFVRRKKMRFVVEVRFLQQGVSVDMEPWMFKPLTNRPILATGA